MGNLRQRLIEKHRLKAVPQEHDDSSPTNLKEILPDDRAAIAHVAARISWPEMKTPGVYEALTRMAHQGQSDYTTVKGAVLEAALALVLGRKDQPQSVRLGSKWVNGSQMPFIPITLNAEDFRTWLEQETRKGACALVRGDPTRVDSEFQALIAHLNANVYARDSDHRPSRLTTSLESIVSDQGDDGDEDETFDWYFDNSPEATALHRVIEELSSPEKEIIKALETKETSASVARRTGRNPAAVRQDKRRVPEKIRQRHPKLTAEIERERDDDLNGDGGFERMLKEADVEARALWEEKCREDSEFPIRVAQRWMLRRGNIESPAARMFRDCSEMKSHSPSDARREQLADGIRRAFKYIRDEARRDWILYNTFRIRKQKAEEDE